MPHAETLLVVVVVVDHLKRMPSSHFEESHPEHKACTLLFHAIKADFLEMWEESLRDLLSELLLGHRCIEHEAYLYESLRVLCVGVVVRQVFPRNAVGGDPVVGVS